MIPKSFGLLFYLKKPRDYAKGERPIYLRITVGGVPKEMSIQRNCNPGRWNSETGRSADKQKLHRSEISIGIDGEKWIFTRRQKTDTASRIPLLPMAQDILDRYADHPQCQVKGHVLPILSNQKMNAYLKEIADCGFRFDRDTLFIYRIDCLQYDSVAHQCGLEKLGGLRWKLQRMPG